MKQVAKIWGAEMHGKVFETDDGQFCYKCDVMYRDQYNDARWRAEESPKFSDLEALIASLPHPRLFRGKGNPGMDPVELAALQNILRKRS